MDPSQIATLTAIAALFKSIGTWPVLSVVALFVLGPWLILVALAVTQHQRFEAKAQVSEKQFNSVVKMYESNVTLVEEVTSLAKGFRDQLIWSTQTVDKANSIAKNNRFCPLVRKNSTPTDVQG